MGCSEAWCPIHLPLLPFFVCGESEADVVRLDKSAKGCCSSREDCISKVKGNVTKAEGCQHVVGTCVVVLAWSEEEEESGP